MDPINYSAMLTQVDLSPLQQGLQRREQNKAIQAEAEQRRTATQLAQVKLTREQEQDTAFREALGGFSANPTPQSLLDLSARFPSHAEALQAGFKTYTAQQQRDVIGTATAALGALAAGKPEVAKAELQKRRAALVNSGIDTSHTDAAIELAGSEDPAKRRQGMALLSTVLLGGVGADETSKIMSLFGLDAASDERRTDNARADRQADIAERRAANSERATNAAIAGRARDDARADRKAAGGSRGGKKGAYSDAQLDALIQ